MHQWDISYGFNSQVSLTMFIVFRQFGYGHNKVGIRKAFYETRAFIGPCHVNTSHIYGIYMVYYYIGDLAWSLVVTFFYLGLMQQVMQVFHQRR